MKRNRLGTLFVLIASLLVGAPAGFAQSGLSIRTAQPTRLTVPPNASSPITMKTLPQATCVLHAEVDNDEKHRMKLFADDEGVIRFHVNPDAKSEEATRFEVDCAANGKISIFPLELRSSSSATTEMPAPAVEVAKVQPGGFVRPALTEDEALRLSDEELAIRQYPERPDREQAPGAFARWLKLVTKPATSVSPRLVNRPDVSHGLFQPNSAWPPNPSRLISRNWSGYLLDSRSSSGTAVHTYDWVHGTWVVPTVSNQYPLGYDLGSGGVASAYSSFWIGLDGYQTNDLVQLGTEQDVFTFCTFSLITLTSHCFTFHSYYAFTEVLPQQQGEQVIANFTVSPGDQIFATLKIANYDGTLNPAGEWVIFDIFNGTRGEHTTVKTPRCWVCTVPGYTAEWIMERPSVNGVLPYLARYNNSPSFFGNVAYMTDAYAQRAVIGGLVNADGTPWGDKSLPIWMVNDPPAAHQGGPPYYLPSDYLSDAYYVNSYQIGYDWVDFY